MTKIPVPTILIIDDDPVILKVIATLLERNGWNIEMAQNGNEGIQRFDDGRVDVVITDITMPGASGNQVAEYVRESNNPRTPVIGITGNPHKIDNQHFDEILTKPFKPLQLISLIKRLLSRLVN
jgi:CheY-like chemotaxis protein